MDFTAALKSVSFTSPSWDLFVLVLFLVGIYLYIFRWGKDRTFVILLAAYVALGLTDRLGFIESTTGVHLESGAINRAVIYVALTAVLAWMFFRSDFFSIFRGGGKRQWFEILVLGFLQLGFITSATISFLSPAETSGLSIFLRTVFAQGQAQLFWLLAPFAAILLLKEK
jgi:hypothetical protein